MKNAWAAKFFMADTLENLVIDYSLNEKGALSSDRPYIGIIQNHLKAKELRSNSAFASNTFASFL